jgi:hypothetical protein
MPATAARVDGRISVMNCAAFARGAAFGKGAQLGGGSPAFRACAATAAGIEKHQLCHVFTFRLKVWRFPLSR